MKMIEIIGHVDKDHRLSATVPANVIPGPVKVAVIVPEEDDAGAAWSAGVASQWSDELNDPREDVYSLEDGEPVNETR